MLILGDTLIKHSMSLRRTRLLKEITLLKLFRHEGVHFPCFEDCGNDFLTLNCISIQITGPVGTPIANKILDLEIQPTDR